MNDFKLLKIRLDLFEGGAAGAAAAGGDGAGVSATGDAQASSGSTRRGRNSGEYSNVVFGKQDAQPAGAGTEGTPAAGEKKAEVQTTSNTLEEKRKQYRAMIEGEFKDFYTEDTQRIINRRFKDSKVAEDTLQKQQPVIDMLMDRYKIADGDMAKLLSAVENDDAYWSEAAEEAGMTTEAFKEFKRQQRKLEALEQAQLQNQKREAAEKQLQQWYTESEEVKAAFPGFDLNTEAQNPRFMAMLKSGVPVMHAYKVMHMDEIMTDAMQTAAKRSEQAVVNNIRARGSRPAENGLSSQSAFTVKDDVSKLSKKDRAEIARRAARGESIKF